MKTKEEQGGRVDSLTPEQRSRRGFEELNGAPFTDAEWREAERNLNEFLRIAIELQENRLTPPRT